MYLLRNERFWWSVMAALGLFPPLMVVLLGGYLAFHGAQATLQIAIDQFMSATWQPLNSQFGLFPLLGGTAAVTLLALLLTVPIGISAALYLTMFAGRRMRQAADTALGILGAMPSVVIGLWAITWIVPQFGNSLSSAALVAAMMITPTFTLLCGAALRQVPADVDENVRALGVSDWVRAMVVLQHARRSVIGALTLTTSRALGEAVAIYLVAGNVPKWPSLSDPVSTLTTTIIGELDVAAGLHRSTLHLLGLLVVILITAASLLGRATTSRG